MGSTGCIVSAGAAQCPWQAARMGWIRDHAWVPSHSLLFPWNILRSWVQATHPWEDELRHLQRSRTREGSGVVGRQVL